MDPQTAEFYRTRAEEWAASHSGGSSTAVDPFLDRLAPGARILDLGCGEGRDSERMIERGFSVEPSDGSAEMAALASRRLGFDVPVMRFDELAARNAFDAVWANAALHHVPLEQLPATLAKIHRALVPGGLHYASYKGGDGAGRDQFGRFYSYVAVAELKAAYRAAGEWAELAIESQDGDSFGGALTLWHRVLVRKAPE